MLFAAALILLPSCFTNNPYRPADATRNIYYNTFRGEPRHLDPAMAYAGDSYEFMYQIYEPVVQYHFLKRPYVLVPLTAEALPEPRFFDKDGRSLPDDASADVVAKAVYEIRLKPGIRYQNHPCFARAADGRHQWHLLSGQSIPRIEHPDELFLLSEGLSADGTGCTREALAEDYVYQIKRLAHPVLACPISAVLATYIDGFAEFQESLTAELRRIREERKKAAGVFYNQEADERANPIYLDMRKFDLPGVQAVDERTFRITLRRKYPQFSYWLAMPFFSPIPWEADRFYTQSAMVEQNVTLDRFPIGTGPYMLAVSQPNYRLVMRRNPNFHAETYPSEGNPEDEKEGLLADSGKTLPFVDEAVYVLEKESVPRWTKFLQGYYDDHSKIGSDMFDQAIRMNFAGTNGMSDELKQQGIRLNTTISMTTEYFAFNMLDDVVGGYDEKKCKLRQALSIALNQEEYIQIFANGRGVAAHSPIPPGIVGYQEGKDGINPVIYDWDEAAGKPRRKSLETARRLLAEAGYPNGRDASGKALVISLDAREASAGAKAEFDWMRKQFESLGVQLQVRITDYNRFQEKVLKGNFQFLNWGWEADYPDPENFLFLLFGPNSKVKSQGENAANYDNPRFNELFKKMENMPNSPARNALIQEMLSIARQDAPWAWGYHLIDYGLYQQWCQNSKPMSVGKNVLKYKRIDAALREQHRQEWNRPITWPMQLACAVLLAAVIAAALIYKRGRRASRT